jgi:hypothetical protein
MRQETPRDPGKPQIPALLPRGNGYQFLLYGDACSGVTGARHEQTFAAVNAVVRRLTPQPEFIVFAGDEIVGLTPDRDQLLAQWRYWLDVEMRWLDRRAIPMWHSTGNHTTYDVMSEGVFRDVLAMPTNGPPGQEGLSYWVRRGDLLLIFVHTLWSGLGGEGFVETTWLDNVLASQSDATHKLVVGHHPVFPINGFSGSCQREIEPVSGANLWRILVEHGVRAYVCSHILAFDVQVHEGVLQLCTAGAGTAHRMPEGIEYLHCVQVALDTAGLRYQVIDIDGEIRESLDWCFESRGARRKKNLPIGSIPAPVGFPPDEGRLELSFSGRSASGNATSSQTLLCAGRCEELPPLWIGFRGERQQLTAILQNEAGRSPHYWLGPEIRWGTEFHFQLLLQWNMGPGGLLYKTEETGAWSSMIAASPWGLEHLRPCSEWHIGRGASGIDDRPFVGTSLAVTIFW